MQSIPLCAHGVQQQLPMNERVKRLILPCLSILALTGIDQWIKYLCITRLKPIGSHRFLALGDLEILRLTFLQNDGAVFSSFSGRRWLLVGITSVMMIVCIYGLIRYAQTSRLLKWSLVLIIGGGIGNLIDRLFRGGLVVDYLEVKLFRFAVFNFADSCVVIGVILFALYFFLIEPKLQKEAEHE